MNGLMKASKMLTEHKKGEKLKVTSAWKEWAHEGLKSEN